MRIAVIGAGVAGLYSAWHLARRHEVVLFEQNGRVGGHTDTHSVNTRNGTLVVDSGFIIFNFERYPLFSRWLEELGVASRVTDMSFGVACRASGLEYNATSLNALFCQRRNLLRPRFIGMVRDILKFYRQAPEVLRELDDSISLGDWLPTSGLGQAFADDHLIPMTSALWSTPPDRVLEFPLRYLLEFMRNHNMLQANHRPIWRTVVGGSHQYVRSALATYRGGLHLSTRVERIRRETQGVRVDSARGTQYFDQVVLACHADQALRMLDEPSRDEQKILGAFEYNHNDTVLHTDASRMPDNRLAWASWNVRRDADGHSGISYWMNSLQGLPGNTPYIVSLNQTDRIDPVKILKRRSYRHPLYTRSSRAAQERLEEINGRARIWFCGACWGWGFHEDAVRSAAGVVEGIEARMQAQTTISRDTADAA